MQELEKLVIAPKEDQNNRMILDRAEGLYAQLNGEPKSILADYIKVFTKVLDSGSKTKIMKASKVLMAYMDRCEQLYLQQQSMDDDLDDFQAWFSALDGAGDDDEPDDWGSMNFLS